MPSSDLPWKGAGKEELGLGGPLQSSPKEQSQCYSLALEQAPCLSPSPGASPPPACPLSVHLSSFSFIWKGIAPGMGPLPTTTLAQPHGIS